MEADALSALIEDCPNMRGPIGDQNVFVTSSRIYSILRAVVEDDAPTFPDVESRREFLSAALGGRVEFFGETALRAKFWFLAPAELVQIPATPLCDEASVTEAQMFTIVGVYFPTSSAQRYAGSSSDALWDGIQGVLMSSPADFRVLCGDFNAHTANLCTKVPLPSLLDKLNASMPHTSDHIALAGREQRLGPSLYIQIQRDNRDHRRPDPQGRTLIDRASECELSILNGARLIPAVRPPLSLCLPPNPPAIDGAPISGQSCEHPSVTQRSSEESCEDPFLGSAL
uniref:Endonuclease/exonuclease/phosphatase domain-containing protein n=1 Tax=Chromera velia CCMP2878 TaxID=1169474 RepID=A0A0G4HQD5_9ALVE|eukprot:Cvel_7948.t1-p1 / transcript=Cvel_7948.t1 / gene=Cvel_7948 / organism=Chromera_velia_CCMP2878 / gene_product=hypothetical protein / transcript_product=hypothetical protein / location=Cvel_scaffold427:34109-41422(-) / protein_length=284 / sequence_SO=supercontig / SO=protein_coding / is_pseudo=false